MKHRFCQVLVLMAMVFLFVAGQSPADDLKQRMLDRLPVIVDLKARGVVGENSAGYLEFLKGQSEKKDVVEAENRDRRAVYEAIAKKQGTTADLVGQRRAIQIAEKANPGEWLQTPQGQWVQK